MKFAGARSFDDLFGLYQRYASTFGFSCFKFPSKTFTISFFGAFGILVNFCIFSLLCILSIKVVIDNALSSSSKVFQVGMNTIECVTPITLWICIALAFHNRKDSFNTAEAFSKFNEQVSISLLNNIYNLQYYNLYCSHNVCLHETTASNINCCC